MSRLVLLFVVCALLAVFITAETGAETSGKERVKRQESGEYPLSDVDLMQRIFQTPLKRQWCRTGLSYNPVLGTCTLSLAAMRGRGRGYRGS